MEFKIRKAIITAAGYGTRQFPATKSIQKEMLPLVDTDGATKPTIQVILEELLRAGIRDAAIIAQPAGAAGFKKHFLRHISDNRFSGKPVQQAQQDQLITMAEHIILIEQSEQRGFGHAVYCAREWSQGEPFLLCLGDHVYSSHETRSCTSQLLDVFEHCKASVIGLAETPEEQLHLFGTVTGKQINHSDAVYRLTRIIEKPSVDEAKSFLRTPGKEQYLTVFGIYAMMPQLFTILESHVRQNKRLRGEIQLSTALAELIDTDLVYGVEINGKRHDMGTPAGYLDTLLSLGLQGPYRKKIVNLFNNELS